MGCAETATLCRHRREIDENRWKPGGTGFSARWNLKFFEGARCATHQQPDQRLVNALSATRLRLSPLITPIGSHQSDAFPQNRNQFALPLHPHLFEEMLQMGSRSGTAYIELLAALLQRFAFHEEIGHARFCGSQLIKLVQLGLSRFHGKIGIKYENQHGRL
jgi:hypothetical protein